MLCQEIDYKEEGDQPEVEYGNDRTYYCKRVIKRYWKHSFHLVLPFPENTVFPSAPTGVPGYVGLDHLRGIDNAVKLLLCYKAEFQCGGLQRKVIVHRVVRNF